MGTKEEQGKPVLINNNSYLTMGSMAMVVAAAIWIKTGQSDAAFMASKTATELQHYKEVSKLNADVLIAKIDGLTETVKAAGADRYTGKDHKIFVERLQELNPGLKIPQP